MRVKILLLFFVFSFLFRADHSFDQDLGRHIKLGEIIIETGQVPKTNLFSYTNPDFPFINTHWLFEVMAFLFQQAGFLQLLLIIKVIAMMVSVWLVLKIIPKEKQALLLPVGFIFLHVLRERIELRPEIFSFLFTATTYYILEKFTKNGNKGILFLPIIQLIWINTHIYFFVGLMLQAIFILSSWGSSLLNPRGWLGRNLRIQLIIFAISVLISLLNPNGLAGLLYPLNVNQNYGYTIVENQTMFFLENINFRNPNFLFVKISTGLIVLSVITAFFRRNFQLRNIFLAILGGVLALMYVRSFPYLVLLSLPATMRNFGPIKSNSATKLLAIIFGGLLLFESYFYLNGDYYKYRGDQHKVGIGFEENVKGAMDFVLANDLPNSIYNNFDIGSYVLYRGFPEYKVFVDGRPEAYPAQFFTGVYIPSQSDYKNFKEVEKIYGLKTIIFSHTDQTPWGRNFLQNVIKDPEWRIVYIDDFTIVLVSLARPGLASVEAIDLAQLNPVSYKFDNHVDYLRLGIFLLSNGYADSGGQFITKTLQIFPQSPIANLIMGNPTQSKFFW